jgi:gluconolactonase
MGLKRTDDFRQDAVRMALTSELTRRQAADDLGVGMSTLNKWITAHRDTGVVSKEDSGRVEPFLTRPAHERLFGVNDLHFASNGDLYFTDQGQSGLHDAYGRLFRLTAGGELDCLISNIPSPNGLVFNETETQLYLAVTRMNAVWRVRFLPGGRTVVKTGTFIQLSGGLAGPDGLALGEGGELVIGHMGLGTVWVMSPLGEPMFRIRSPEGLLTANCAFGGPEGRNLYITEAETSTILRVELSFRGKQMFSHQN